MKKTAFIFSQSPYGNSIGKEGLDVSLAFSLINKKTGIFFIGDGIFQLFEKQNPRKILFSNYTVSFKIFSIYGITQFYSSIDSFKERGLSVKDSFLVNLLILNNFSFRRKLDSFDNIFKF